MKAGFEPRVEVQPLRVIPHRVIREDSLESFRSIASLRQQLRPQCPIRSEDSLLHSQRLHLLQNVPCRNLVGPQYDRISPRRQDDPQFAHEICIPRQELLLDYNRMPEPPRGIAEFQYAEPSIAAVHTQ